MNRTLLVARREFRQRIRTRGFLISALLTPLILLTVGLFAGRGAANSQAAAAVEPAAPSDPIGYVDQADLIHVLPDSMPDDLLRSFADIEAADAALARAEIAAYYIIPPAYRETGEVRWVGEDLPLAPPDTRWIDDLLLANLLADVEPDIRLQIRRPFNAKGLLVASTDSEGTGMQDNALNLLPLMVALVIIMPLFTGGGYLFQSLVQEKSSRVMEVLLLSLRPHQLLTGKLLGLGALTAAQYLIWLAMGLIGLLVIGDDLTEALTAINLSGTELLLLLLYALGGFALYAALMAGMGAMTPNIESNRAWVFIISLPMILPIYLWAAIVAAPNGPLAVTLSLIPFSAPVAMLMRISATTVPGWQVGVSLLLLALTAAGIIGLMARLFRAQTLLSGESFSLRRLWGAVSAS